MAGVVLNQLPRGQRPGLLLPLLSGGGYGEGVYGAPERPV
jgi:hypothetical protein